MKSFARIVFDFCGNAYKKEEREETTLIRVSQGIGNDHFNG
jgi:hypothetical protein